MCATNFNHLHIDLQPPQNRLIKDTTTDSYFQRCLGLRIYHFADDLEAVFRTIDPSPKGFANRICRAPKDKVHLAALVTTWRIIRRSEVHLQDQDAVVAQSYVSHSGHFSVSAARMTGLMISKELIGGEYIARTMLRSFPQGALLISPDWMTRLELDNDKLAFIQEHADRITTSSKEYFEKSGKLKDCGVLFGSSSLIKVHDVITQWTDGRLIQTVIVAPTHLYPLEGINLWMFEWNPANPSDALFCNAFMGSSPVCLVTAFVNTEIERDLVRTMWRTIAHFQEAQTSGFHLEDWLAKEAPGLLRRRRIYQGFEFFPRRAVEMRKILDNHAIAPKVSVKAFTDTLESNDFCFERLIDDGNFVNMLPDAGRPPEFTVNGMPITADNFLFFRKWDGPFGSSLYELSSAELAMVKNQVQLYCKTQVTKELLDEVRKVLDPLYDAHVDCNKRDEYERKYAIIESTTNLNLVAKQILHSFLLGDAVVHVADKLSKHFPRFRPLEIRAIISWVATYTVFLSIMRPDSLIAQWGIQRIRHLCISNVTAAAIKTSPEAQLSKLAEDLLHQLQAVEEVRVKIESADKTDPVQLIYQEELKSREMISEETMRKKAGLETAEEERLDPDRIFERQRQVENDVREKIVKEITMSTIDESVTLSS